MAVAGVAWLTILWSPLAASLRLVLISLGGLAEVSS
jgi:hypothetical protein